ncbi:reticulon-4-interacting protein 1 [Cordyceps fumosorosea ARSEF 2679]|uniref:Reticulon-4-interacting protein 1 n=1 Tax=Cordyceps fumosorosea (strain ARSEF 2679) TaxID=1081104 RepID=A0A167P868_CORFA|nr:reticulon-4-interacting protein 1 [Cordyceps fumosorosea ARSEF 2679]OAA56387.1 reticulon-4-interacting protein 1 [Cordyceps fumosorosea ARSEF 2679]
MTDQMQAWQVTAPGPISETLKFTDEATKPSAASLRGDQILIQVQAAAINPADYKTNQMGSGFLSRALISYPKTLGMDLAGIVAAVGPGASDIKEGDHVFARIDPLKQPGALSQYIISNRDGYAKVADCTNLSAAACLGTAGLTAYQSIYPYVDAGNSIFINGGSGGVGTLAIQIGKILGCHVTASCSTSKVNLCRDMGADEIIDYKTADVVETLQKSGRQYSLVLDYVGKSPQNFYITASTVLTKKGVLILGSPTISTIINATLWPGCLGGSKHKVVTYLTKNSHDDMVQLSKWLDDGSLRVAIEKSYDFSQVMAAYEHLKKGSTAGKIVIQIP